MQELADLIKEYRERAISAEGSVDVYMQAQNTVGAATANAEAEVYERVIPELENILGILKVVG